MIDLTGKTIDSESLLLAALAGGFDLSQDMGIIQVTGSQAVAMHGFTSVEHATDRGGNYEFVYNSPFGRHVIQPVRVTSG